MERLDISIAPEHANIEAAIHCARYALGKSLVRGKRVLDIACGEGYGSYLLKQAGAEHVVGVDVSAESITRAQSLFGCQGLEFKEADAANLEALFSENEFDVIISIETIEHLGDPISFLKGLKRIAKSDAVIILSCPNDHWYYPEDHQANPYHQRKYHLKEFQELCTGILGIDVRWSVGTGVFGFGTTPLNLQDDYYTVPGSWISYLEASGAYLVNGEGDPAILRSRCSFFIGIWNAPEWITGIAVFPISMDNYAKMISTQDGDSPLLESERLQNKLNDALARLSNANDELSSANKTLRSLGLRLQASEAERTTIRDALIATRAECESYRIVYQRIAAISRLIPESLRPLAVRIVRLIRRRKET